MVVLIDHSSIIYPAYTDAQLVNGQAVSPDQSYTPQAIAQAKNIVSS